MLSRLPPARLVTLDATGTLIKLRPALVDQYADIARKFGLTPSRDRIGPAFREGYKEMWAEVPNFGYDIGMTSLEWWTKVVRKTMQKSGVPFQQLYAVQEEMGQHAFNHFATKAAWALAHDGVPSLLSNLKKRGAMVGVVSNFDERLEGILRDLQLRDQLDFVLVSREAGVPKPHHLIFQRALDYANLSASGQFVSGDCVHIGDDWTNDVEGAIESHPRWKAVWISHGAAVPPPRAGDDRDTGTRVAAVDSIGAL